MVPLGDSAMGETYSGIKVCADTSSESLSTGRKCVSSESESLDDSSLERSARPGRDTSSESESLDVSSWERNVERVIPGLRLLSSGASGPRRQLLSASSALVAVSSRYE